MNQLLSAHETAARLPYDAYANHRAGLSEISAGRFGEAVRHLLLAAALAVTWLLAEYPSRAGAAS